MIIQHANVSRISNSRIHATQLKGNNINKNTFEVNQLEKRIDLRGKREH